MQPPHYPKPTPMGGTMIRAVLKNFKNHSFSLPIQKPIAIAVSGGVDSMVLAHLISRYGRKIVQPDLVTLLHFDHGWRKESRTLERAGVKALAKKLRVNFLAVDLDPPKPKVNKELDAREKRNHAYAKLDSKFEYILTAHHQDDVIETLIWRFFRGEFDTHAKGILFQDHHVLRPFLDVSKEEIYRYAKEEKIKFFEDPTNQDKDQMRAQLRSSIIPRLEKLFPGLKRSVAKYAITARKR